MLLIRLRLMCVWAMGYWSLVVSGGSTALAQLSQDDVPYRDNGTYAPEAAAYISQRCRLDVHLPAAPTAKFPLLVWFHGGGLTGGNKNAQDELIAIRHLVAQGVGVVAANYRLSPQVVFPAHLEDAAAAVRWATDHAAELDADPARVYVGGFSAGGYITAMLALDPRFLAEVQAGPVAGFVAISGQMTTHFTVRAQRGLAKDAVVVDAAAPLAHVRPGIPRLLLVIGDHDWPARLEENQLLAATLEKLAKNPPVPLVVAPDRTHATMLTRFGESNDLVAPAVLNFIQP